MRTWIALYLAAAAFGAFAPATPAGAEGRSRFGQRLPWFLSDYGPNGVVFVGQLKPGDVDEYRFWLREGDVLTASLLDGADGEFNDPLLGVFAPSDPDGEPGARSDDGGPGFLPRLALRAGERGLWTVAVTGFGDDDFDGSGHEERLRYRLVVASQSAPPHLSEREGRGGNDTPGSPDRVPLRRGAAVVSGTLGPGDTDVFELWLYPGATLTASLFDALAGEFNDSLLRLRDRDGNILAESDDGGPGFLSNLSLAAPDGGRGRHPVPVFLEVTGFDPNAEDEKPHRERFAYQLVVSVDRLPGP